MPTFTKATNCIKDLAIYNVWREEISDNHTAQAQATRDAIAQAVSDGKTDGELYTDTPGDGTIIFTRHWIDLQSAEDWKAFLETTDQQYNVPGVLNINISDI